MSNVELTCLAGGPGSRSNAWLLGSESSHVLLDAGAEPDGSAAWISDLKRAPDAVVITHAHWDHAGGLAKLFERFGVLPVFATSITKRLLPLLTSEVLEHTGAKNSQGRATAISDTVTSLEFHVRKEIGDIFFEMMPSGHLLGSAMVHAGRGEGSVLYTSDYCLRTQASVGAADLVALSGIPWIVEAALAGTPIFDDAAWEVEAQTKLERALGRDKCLIGVSSLGNSVELLVRVQKLSEFVVVYEGLKPALAATRLTDGVDFQNRDGCKAALQAGTPVLVSGVDFNLNGISGELALSLANDTSASIVVTRDIGFARDLVRTPRRSRLRMGGQTMRLKAHVEWVRLPNHSTRTEIVEEVTARQPPQVVLTHGSENALHQLRRELVKSGYDGEASVGMVGGVWIHDGNVLRLKPS